jgi:hypothetical protein
VDDQRWFTRYFFREHGHAVLDYQGEVFHTLFQLTPKDFQVSHTRKAGGLSAERRALPSMSFHPGPGSPTSPQSLVGWAGVQSLLVDQKATSSCTACGSNRRLLTACVVLSVQVSAGGGLLSLVTGSQPCILHGNAGTYGELFDVVAASGWPPERPV